MQPEHTITANCSIQVRGKIARIKHENGRIIAEFLVHGPLSSVIENCNSNVPITKGYPNIFRGELFGLAGYEILDTENECIIEK